jgi:hypothetical protein
MLWKQNTQYGQAHFCGDRQYRTGPRKQAMCCATWRTFTAQFGRLSTRQPAHLGAVPKCLTQSPCRAARPLAVSVRFCAVASHRTSSPRSRLRRHLLAARTVCATVEETYCKRPTKNQAGSKLNTSLDFRHGFSAFSGVQPGLCLTGRSRGTSMLRMAAP